MFIQGIWNCINISQSISERKGLDHGEPQMSFAVATYDQNLFRPCTLMFVCADLNKLKRLQIVFSREITMSYGSISYWPLV